jgi:hypothetical protein
MYDLSDETVRLVLIMALSQWKMEKF